MNISYNAAVSLVASALGWPLRKAISVLLTDHKLAAPADRDAPGLVPVTPLGHFIHRNLCDANNHEY